jgi:hypothetical protein
MFKYILTDFKSKNIILDKPIDFAIYQMKNKNTLWYIAKRKNKTNKN